MYEVIASEIQQKSVWVINLRFALDSDDVRLLLHAPLSDSGDVWQAIPTRVLASRAAQARRGQQHVSYAPSQGEDSMLGQSMHSTGWHNGSASILDSSSMVALANTTVGDSTLGSAYMYGESCMLHDSGLHSEMHSSGRDYSAAKQALASISAALSPMVAAPGNSIRNAPHGMSRMSARDQYSIPPPAFTKDGSVVQSQGPFSSASFSRERMASAVREDVGSKRMRESFAPEPSPLLATDRRNAGTAVRPAQRRRLAQPNNTVKKIMDIIKDTSTSHTDARYVVLYVTCQHILIAIRVDPWPQCLHILTAPWR